MISTSPWLRQLPLKFLLSDQFEPSLGFPDRECYEMPQSTGGGRLIAMGVENPDNAARQPNLGNEGRRIVASITEQSVISAILCKKYAQRGEGPDCSRTSW